MIRTLSSLAVVLVLSTVASASLHTFDATPAPGEANAITVLGDGNFELGPSTNGFQYPVVPGNGLDISVDAQGGPVVLSLVRGATLNNSAVLVFEGGADVLRVIYQNASIMMGDAFPDITIDGTTTVGFWNSTLAPPSTANTLAGQLGNGSGVTAVPEPSAFAFGGLAIGLVAAGRFVRRKFGQSAE